MRGKDEQKIVIMRKSQQTSQHGTEHVMAYNVKTRTPLQHVQTGSNAGTPEG